MNLWETLLYYLKFPFVQYALIAGTLIALSSSLLGVSLTLKRFSFIGDGLSHVAFGAMSVAAILNLKSNLLLIMPVTALAAILLLNLGQKTKLKGDALVAILSVSSLALGYLLINVFSASANVSGDVCSSLFGSTSILTLQPGDVWLCVCMSLLVVAVFVVFYNKIFAVTFDETFARATGVQAGFYNLFLSVVMAVVISLSMRLVGSLLISALVVFPALSAMRVFKSFFPVVVASAVISVVAAVLGMLVSILWGTPVGSTVVLADLLAFFAFSAAGALRRKKA